MPLPTRDATTNEYKFADRPEFRPNLSPQEVLQMGSFGGTYFRPIKSSVTNIGYGEEVWKELPSEWLKGLNVKTQIASSTYRERNNRYGVKCGGSLEMWEESGWMRDSDPYGWFQWCVPGPPLSLPLLLPFFVIVTMMIVLTAPPCSPLSIHTLLSPHHCTLLLSPLHHHYHHYLPWHSRFLPYHPSQ